MAERFFYSKKEQHFSRRNDDDDDDKEMMMMLVSGPVSSGKTSLLFQFAFNSAAAHPDGNVVFICNRQSQSLNLNPPFLSQDIDPSSPTFQRIHIIYFDDFQGITNFFAAFHLHHPSFPCAVLIDDFSLFFHHSICKERYGNHPRAKEVAMVRTLALCHNAIMHANEKSPCKLVLSDTHHHHGDSPRLLFIFKRWLSTIFTITGDGCGSFTLKCNQDNDDEKNGRSVAKYSIALQHLFLEGITHL